jgi:hypothetical protein
MTKYKIALEKIPSVIISYYDVKYKSSGRKAADNSPRSWGCPSGILVGMKADFQGRNEGNEERN